MALASGTPGDTVQYHQISASGAIRVGSSPTLIKISFCLCMVNFLFVDVGTACFTMA